MGSKGSKKTFLRVQKEVKNTFISWSKMYFKRKIFTFVCNFCRNLKKSGKKEVDRSKGCQLLFFRVDVWGASSLRQNDPTPKIPIWITVCGMCFFWTCTLHAVPGPSMSTGWNQTCTWHAVPWCVACFFSGLVPCMQCQGLACALDETKHVRGMQCHGAWHVHFLDLYVACSASTQHVHWMRPNLYVACSAMVPGMCIFWSCTWHAVPVPSMCTESN